MVSEQLLVRLTNVNVLTYTTKHKEQVNTSAFDRMSSSGVRREKIIKDNERK